MTKRYFTFPKKHSNIETINETIERINEFCFELENEKNFLIEIEKLERNIIPDYKIIGLSRLCHKINELFNKTNNINDITLCLKLILKLSNIGPKIFNKIKNKSLNNYELFSYKDFEFNLIIEICKNILIHEQANDELLKLSSLILISFNQFSDLEIYFSDILYVQYIFSDFNKKIEILKTISTLTNLMNIENIELYKIGLGKLNKYDFLAKELILIKNKKIIFEILMLQKNHKLLQKLIGSFDFNNFSGYQLIDILVNTISDNNLLPTLGFLEYLLETNKMADIIIQRFIIQSNKYGAAPLILRRNQIITEDFILCCLISNNQLNFLNTINSKNILESEYFFKFSNDFESYKLIIEKALNDQPSINQIKLSIKNISKNIIIKSKQIHFLIENYSKFLNYFKDEFLFLIKQLNKIIMPQLLETIILIKNTKFVELLIPFLFQTDQKQFIDFLFSIEDIYISRFMFSSIKFINLNFKILIEKQIYLEKLSLFKIINENLNYWNTVCIKNMEFEKFQNYPEFFQFIKKEPLNLNNKCDDLHEEFKKKLKLDLCDKFKINYSPLIEYNESSISLFSIKQLTEIIKQSIFNELKEDEIIQRLNRLIELSKYNNGIVFFNSLLEFKINSNEFSCYFELCQYDSTNEQEILRVSSEKEIFKLLISNGIIKYEIKTSLGSEIIKLNEFNLETFKIELKYKNKKLNIILGNSKIIENIEKIKIMQIGHLFRGIISNILIFESIIDKPVLFNENFYNDTINIIEKKLRYNAKRGIFMDSKNFMQLSYAHMKINFDNILTNKNLKCKEEIDLINEMLELTNLNGIHNLNIKELKNLL